MIDHTLSSSLYLYQVHRNRQHYLTSIEKRKAIKLVSAITFCVTVSSILWIVYGK